MPSLHCPEVVKQKILDIENLLLAAVRSSNN
jgi:hypothetical protein